MRRLTDLPCSALNVEILDDALQLYEGHTGALLTELKGHTDEVYEVVFSPDHTRLLTVGADGTARLWAVQGDLPVVF